MKYRVLAADLDGTLVTDDKRVTERTKEAVKAMTEKGGIMVLASGRPSHGIWPVAKELSLDEEGGYILAYNGGELIDCRDGSIKFSVSLPKERIPQIISLSRQYETAILTYEGADIITESSEDPYVHGEARNVRMNIRQIDDLIAYLDFPVVKLMMVGSEEKIAEMEPIVREALGEEFSVFRSEAYHLEILPAGIDKGSGLVKTLEYLNIPAQESIACGDYDNDVPMVKAAGLGVSMENGCPMIRECADYITASNEADGVARVIERFMLEKPAD